MSCEGHNFKNLAILFLEKKGLPLGSQIINLEVNFMVLVSMIVIFNSRAFKKVVVLTSNKKSGDVLRTTFQFGG